MSEVGEECIRRSGCGSFRRNCWIAFLRLRVGMHGFYVAPELLGAMPCIDAARKAGIVVAIGHTDATYEQARAAIAHGAHHAVHVYNAMRPFSHRDSGVIGAS